MSASIFRRLKKLSPLLVFSLIIFTEYLPLSAQIKEPVLPSFPVIDSDIDRQIFKFKARITLYGKTGIVEDVIVFNSDILSTSDGRHFKIKDINRINILAWQKKTKFNKHLFYPSQYELLFKDYKKIIIPGNIEIFNKIKTVNKKAVYSYFYDNFKKGTWSNSGVIGFDAEVLKPVQGCVISIELTQ